MGGRTFRWLIDNGVKENPYQGKKVVVISSKVTDIDWDIEFYSGDLDELLIDLIIMKKYGLLVEVS